MDRLMSKIKVGQIGVSHEHAGGKMKSLRLRPDLFDIVGVVDDSATAAAKFAGQDMSPYSGLRFLTEEELLQTPGLQAVLVETPNLELVPTAQRCLERGLAIHMDKPGGDDLDAFTRLRRGYSERRLPFQMGYMFRVNPAMQWIRRAVARGWLGDVFEVQASMSHNYGGAPYQEYLGKFRGGIMFNLGCHLIDVVVALLGRPTRVTPFLHSAPGDPEHVANHAVAVLEYPHAMATLWACSRELDGLGRRRLKVCGTRGSVELCPLERFDGRPLQMNLVLQDGNEAFPAGRQVLDFGPVRDRYEEQMVELARMVHGAIPEPFDCRHDVLVQDVLLQASGNMPRGGEAL